MVCIIAMSSFTIYDLQTRPRWVHPCTAIAILLASVIGATVGVRENRLATGVRLRIVMLWCIMVSALCILWGETYPLPKMPGDPLDLGRNHPLIFGLLAFVFVGIVCSVIGMIVEEITAFIRRCVSRWFVQGMVNVSLFENRTR